MQAHKEAGLIHNSGVRVLSRVTPLRALCGHAAMGFAIGVAIFAPILLGSTVVGLGHKLADPPFFELYSACGRMCWIIGGAAAGAGLVCLASLRFTKGRTKAAKQLD